MIIIKKEILKNYLKTIGRNQSWLAERMGYGKSYVSQVLNNDCQISKGFVERILMITHYQFEDLFKFDGGLDTREFYGETYIYEGNVLNKAQYNQKIRERDFDYVNGGKK